MDGKTPLGAAAAVKNETRSAPTDSLRQWILMMNPRVPDECSPEALRLARSLRDCGLPYAILTPDQALEQLQHSPSRQDIALVVVGPDVRNPLATAQRVRALWPDGHMLFTPRPRQLPAWRHRLERAPLIGSNWSLVSTENPTLLQRVLDQVRHTRHRKRLLATLAQANISLSQAQTAPLLPRQDASLSIEALAQANERQRRLFEAVLSASADLVFVFNQAGRLMYANPAMASFLGIPVEQLLDKRPEDLNTPAEAARILREHLDQVMTHLRPVRAELPMATDGARQSVLEYILVPVVDELGRVEAVAGTARDITERKKSSERIWREANYDALTGLPNRRLFRDRLEQEIRHAQRADVPFALFFLDLDHFKQVNDLHGHDAGDELLRQVAQRIRSCVRQSDTVARLGGDEFTVILTELHNVSPIEHIAEKILQELARPFRLGSARARIGCSIGITLFPEDATEAEALIRNADQAMYAAKHGGRNRFSFFTQAMQDAALERLRLIDDLRQSLEEGQLQLYYQPIVDLRTGQIRKAEALLRWHHPELGLVSPARFIPLAEESGQIQALGDWVFQQAAEQAMRWHGLWSHPFQISINKSPLQFMGRPHHPQWIRHLKQLALPPASLSIEITENVLLNASAHVAEALTALQQAGIELAIDDFGTGYASMVYLKKYDVDYLKIDQSFVRDINAHENNRTIIEGTIAMAHKMGLEVIAEGIEEEAQRDWLKSVGCDHGQGYLFAQPLPVPEFEALIQND